MRALNDFPQGYSSTDGALADDVHERQENTISTVYFPPQIRGRRRREFSLFSDPQIPAFVVRLREERTPGSFSSMFLRLVLVWGAWGWDVVGDLRSSDMCPG
jgi:hypothetical protein